MLKYTFYWSLIDDNTFLQRLIKIYLQFLKCLNYKEEKKLSQQNLMSFFFKLE